MGEGGGFGFYTKYTLQCMKTKDCLYFLILSTLENVHLLSNRTSLWAEEGGGFKLNYRIYTFSALHLKILFQKNKFKL